MFSKTNCFNLEVEGRDDLVLALVLGMTPSFRAPSPFELYTELKKEYTIIHASEPAVVAKQLRGYDRMQVRCHSKTQV